MLQHSSRTARCRRREALAAAAAGLVLLGAAESAGPGSSIVAGAAAGALLPRPGGIDSPSRSPTIQLTSVDGASRLPVPAVLMPSVLTTNHPLNADLVRRSGTEIEVRAAPGARLRAWVRAVPYSGGHRHGHRARQHGWLRMEAQDRRSYPPLPGQPGFENGGTTLHGSYEDGVRIRTSRQGKAFLYYIAPELCGLEKVYVATEAEPDRRRKVSLALEVRVPDLNALPGGPTISRKGSLARHPYNHFGTARLIQALEALAKNYRAQTGKPLPVNDMSLPHGGMYDFRREWTGPHVGHRLGTEVDVGSTLTGLVPRDSEFETILAEQGWFVPLPEGRPPHYHLILAGSGRVTLRFRPLRPRWRSRTARELEIPVLVVNHGGLDASSAWISAVRPEGGVRLVDPPPYGIGEIRIRARRQVLLRAQVPAGVSRFDLWLSALARAGEVERAFPSSARLRVCVDSASP